MSSYLPTLEITVLYPKDMSKNCVRGMSRISAILRQAYTEQKAKTERSNNIYDNYSFEEDLYHLRINFKEGKWE